LLYLTPSPTRRGAFPPSLRGKGARGLGDLFILTTNFEHPLRKCGIRMRVMPDGDVNHATHRCDAFLTNEVRLKQADTVCVLVLDDLAEEVPRD
jgi:hypothetical protein